MSDQNPSGPSKKDSNNLPVSRRDFVRRIVGGTGAALPGMTILGSVLPGATVKAADTAVEVFATDDATLSALHPATPYGGDQVLAVGTDGVDDLYDAVVQFQASQIQAGIAAAAQNGQFAVYLVVWVESATLFPPGQVINAHPKSGTFNEGTVTWDAPQGSDFASATAAAGVQPQMGYIELGRDRGRARELCGMASQAPEPDRPGRCHAHVA